MKLIKLTKFNKANTFLYCLLIVLFFYSFHTLLLHDTLLNYDDKMLLNGVENLHSLNNYFDRFLSGQILDLQPIRDLSYFLDFKLKTIFSFHSFHLTNLFIWMGICLLFKNILTILNLEIPEQKENQWLIWSLVFLYAVGPISTSSVAWIAARKHLLSTFFTMAATFLFLKKRNSILDFKSIFAISFFYLLGTLSQPINVLWPIFPFLCSFFDSRLNNQKKLFIILTCIGVVILCANLYYYNSLFLRITAGDGKFDSDYGVGLSLLALGRYFYLTIFPFNALPVSHFQGAWENIVGLVLLIIFIFLCYKNKNKKKKHWHLLFLAYFFLPLVPVTYKITRIFCSDTYLLNASAGIYISLFFLLESLSFKKNYIFIFIYAGILFIQNLDYIQTFQGADSIWQYSYEKEPTAFSIVALADLNIKRKDYSKAGLLLSQLEALEPENRFLVKLKSDAIYQNIDIRNDEKIRKLESLESKKPIVFLELALLYSNMNNKVEFQKNIIKLLLDPQSYIENSYLINEEVVALVKVSCEKNNIEEICKQHFTEFNKKVSFVAWNKKLFLENYFSLKKHPGTLFYH